MFFDSLNSLVDPRKPLARDLTEVKLGTVAVTVPTRAVVLTRSVWTFRLEATTEALLASSSSSLFTTRSLEDFAWLRRALVFAVPGAVVPPGPLTSYASSRDSVATGEAPYTNEEAETLRRTTQTFLTRMLGHVELRDEPLFKSFCLDEPERWDARKKEANAALEVAPAMVQIGAKWSFATETMGLQSATNMAAAKIGVHDRAEMDKAQEWEQWVVGRDRDLDRSEKAARRDADAALTRDKATTDLIDALAETTDQGTDTSTTQRGWEHVARRGRRGDDDDGDDRRAGANGGSSKSQESDKAADGLTSVQKESAHVTLLGHLADLRAYLAAAQEALNMRDLCRRESWTARRHCAEKRASFEEREAQLKLAAQREEQAASTSSAFQSFSLTAQSALASYHADVALATKHDVLQAEKLDGLLRHRFDVAKVRLYAHLTWLADSWHLRCQRALFLFAAHELRLRAALSADFTTALEGLRASANVDDKAYDIPVYQPPDFAKELAKIKALHADVVVNDDFLEPKRSPPSAILQEVSPPPPPPPSQENGNDNVAMNTAAAATPDTIKDLNEEAAI
mmetsp:Transcript_28004/g.90293  ORF Transcript_28004/g.90293 Transcript_28004/m.90293 type:complete len:570 (-) Transcript_28004:193-1902(-)